MSLSQSQVRATAAVADIATARDFYEGKLGLTAMPGGPEQVRIYECGSGSLLQVYESPDYAGASGATALSWSVPDGFDAQIDELTGAGVSFERYDNLASDERGVHEFGGHRVAWFKDPDGNVIAIDNGGPV